MIQYVIGVLMKMPFYWHLIYWFSLQMIPVLLLPVPRRHARVHP